VNVCKFQRREFERFGNGQDWANAEFFGRTTCSGISNETAQRLEAEGFSARVAHDNGSGGAIAEGRTIARGGRNFYVKRRLKRSEELYRSVGAREFVGFELEGLGGRLLSLSLC